METPFIPKGIDTRALAEKIVPIFGSDRILSAFVAGSIASGTARRDSDIDLFVCTKQPPTDWQKQQFVDYYNNLHVELGRPPDIQYPGELVDCDTLAEALNVVDRTEPSSVIRNPKVYDGIVWAGMLTGRQLPLIVYDPTYVGYASKAEVVIGKWATRLLGQQHVYNAYDKSLKRTITFQ